VEEGEVIKSSPDTGVDKLMGDGKKAPTDHTKAYDQQVGF
jgi:hypothetical protein